MKKLLALIVASLFLVASTQAVDYGVFSALPLFATSINNQTLTATTPATVPIPIGANVTLSIPLTDSASSVGSVTFYFDTSVDGVNWVSYALNAAITAPNNTTATSIVTLPNVQANFIRLSKMGSTQTSAVTIGAATYSVWPQ